jgi:hypothetical protein
MAEISPLRRCMIDDMMIRNSIAGDAAILPLRRCQV